MSDTYNHEGENIFEAIGLANNEEEADKIIEDIRSKMDFIERIIIKRDRIVRPSELIEEIEKKFNKKELAFLSYRVLFEPQPSSET